VAVLGGGAVAAAALGLHQRKKNAAAATAGGATIPGTIPAAAVIGGGASTATYDSTAFDIYDSLQQQIGDLRSAIQTGSTPAPAPAPAPALTPGPPILSQPGPPPAPVYAPPPPPPPARSTVYTVVSGDNLSRIAQRYGTSWQAIYGANRGVVGSNPNMIHPGERLTIPGR
jgi:nucleoid-associated protein YgaU